MLNSSILRDGIIKDVSDLTDSRIIHNNIANRINRYLLDNLEVYGFYRGMIPGTPPVLDPLTGNYSIRIIRCGVNGNILLSSAKVNMQSWYNSIVNQIANTSIINVYSRPLTLLTPVKIFLFIRPSILNLKTVKNFKGSWDIIINTLVRDIKRAKPFLTIGARSTSGGIGNIQFINFN